MGVVAPQPGVRARHRTTSTESGTSLLGLPILRFAGFLRAYTRRASAVASAALLALPSYRMR